MIEHKLYEYMDGQLAKVSTDFMRYKYAEINWDSQLVGIVGPRGVGKSTMVLQRITKTPENVSLYVSADNLYFTNHTLVALADDFVKEGGTHLYIDEIHKYGGWSRELKQIYDTHADLHVVFTGSSVLDIRRGEADLSRRALMYAMQGLSFREYLELFHHVAGRTYTLKEILNHQVVLEGIEHPLPLFRDYLHQGYYPFALQGNFAERMQMIVAQTLEVDIPQYADMRASTARKLARMLTILSRLVPYKPVADALATEIGVSKNNVPDYLVYLERAGLLGLLRDDTAGMRALGKVEKAYLDNPSLMSVLAGGQPDMGNMRETFFYNQMRVRYDITASRASDFTIAPYTFEVGGRKKWKRQIKDIDHGIIVRDDIETGHGIFIPLWHFGLTY